MPILPQRVSELISIVIMFKASLRHPPLFLAPLQVVRDLLFPQGLPVHRGLNTVRQGTMLIRIKSGHTQTLFRAHHIGITSPLKIGNVSGHLSLAILHVVRAMPNHIPAGQLLLGVQRILLQLPVREQHVP